MSDPAHLGTLFLAQVAEPQRHRLADRPELPQVLADALAAARSAWPDVVLPADRFLACLARRVPDRDDPLQGLRELHAIDLYLACACADGDPHAIAALEQHGFRDLETALRRLRFDRPQIDEIKQRLRHELFVSAPGAAPRITGYSGRGQLHRWLRVIGVRTARRLRRRDHAAVTIDDHLMEGLPARDASPELAHMKRLYRDAFQAAFADAVRVLPEDARQVLRQHFVEGLSIDALGQLHGVHRATAARWLATARELVASHTRKHLIARLGIAATEYDSVMQLIHSQLDISLHRYLG